MDDVHLIVKGFFYALILIYASYKDIKEKIIPDKVHLMSSILGFIIVPLPFFITALLKDDGIGGGDVKLMAASDVCYRGYFIRKNNFNELATFNNS